jgi:hypothetical protein
LIVFGIINGGLGIRLAGNANGGEKAVYIIIVLIMFTLYIGAQVLYRIRIRKKMEQKTSTEEAQQKVEWDRLNQERGLNEII